MTVKNSPGKAAVALSYDAKTMHAPIVSATGELALAKEMENIARRYGIKVRRSSETVDRLRQAATGEEIPEELYEPVAAVFAQLERQRF